MKKIFLTGGCGFIGRHLVKKLLQKYIVINVDKLTYASDLIKIKDKKLRKRYYFFKKDINNFFFLKKLLDNFKPDFLIHCAAETHVDRSIKNPKIFIENNIDGTFSILEAVKFYLQKNKKKKFKFIYISTDEVYGDILNKRDSHEMSTLSPSSPYSSSKAAAEHLVFAWNKTFGVPVIVTRCSNNYGPGQNEEKFIPMVINNIIDNKPVKIYKDGMNIREWLYVEDHVDAIIEVLEHGRVSQIYNIGSGYKKTNIYVAKYISKIMEKNFKTSKIKIEFIDDRVGHDFKYSLNFKKIKNELNWKPKFRFKRGIILTVASLFNKFKLI
jgi:dTDP-glucose 4,6-dehydratase